MEQKYNNNEKNIKEKKKKLKAKIIVPIVVVVVVAVVLILMFVSESNMLNLSRVHNQEIEHVSEDVLENVSDPDTESLKVVEDSEGNVKAEYKAEWNATKTVDAKVAVDTKSDTKSVAKLADKTASKTVDIKTSDLTPGSFANNSKQSEQKITPSKQDENKQPEQQKEEKQEEPGPVEITAKWFKDEIEVSPEEGHEVGWYVCNTCGDKFVSDAEHSAHIDNTGHGGWHVEGEYVVDKPAQYATQYECSHCSYIGSSNPSKCPGCGATMIKTVG